LSSSIRTIQFFYLKRCGRVIVRVLDFVCATPDTTPSLLRATTSCNTGTFAGRIALVGTFRRIDTVEAGFFALETVETSFFCGAFLGDLFAIAISFANCDCTAFASALVFLSALSCWFLRAFAAR
jgi:hypothetical protein